MKPENYIFRIIFKLKQMTLQPKKIKTYLLLCLFAFTFSVIAFSCKPVKAYEKVYLNDPDMELSTKKVDNFEQNAHVYREGASGANGGKSGGGCGCN